MQHEDLEQQNAKGAIVIYGDLLLEGKSSDALNLEVA